MWKTKPFCVNPYVFDTKVHYPFGAGSSAPEADIVYRSVPIYNASVLRQISQSVTSGAAKRQSSTADIGAGVPKAPIVRELFVDAVTGNPIGDKIYPKIG